MGVHAVFIDIPVIGAPMGVHAVFIIDGTFVKHELLSGYELNELFSQNYELLKSSFFFFENLRIIYQIWQIHLIKTSLYNLYNTEIIMVAGAVQPRTLCPEKTCLFFLFFFEN